MHLVLRRVFICILCIALGSINFVRASDMKYTINALQALLSMRRLETRINLVSSEIIISNFYLKQWKLVPAFQTFETFSIYFIKQLQNGKGNF